MRQINRSRVGTIASTAAYNVVPMPSRRAVGHHLDGTEAFVVEELHRPGARVADEDPASHASTRTSSSVEASRISGMTQHPSRRACPSRHLGVRSRT